MASIEAACQARGRVDSGADALGRNRLVDLRDQALLLTAFASGGRRRSEVAGLRIEDLIDKEPVHADPVDKSSPALPCPVSVFISVA
ncbi:integrase [Sinorhizobium kostiense]|uniref:Integrase n=1 Tax=Sinorhizobium kostiense TaxID=76747 RepID=A0ABS4R0A6_9HYPH|nr:integrase [Sinorhizobium kostiense]